MPQSDTLANFIVLCSWFAIILVSSGLDIAWKGEGRSREIPANTLLRGSSCTQSIFA